MPDHGCGQKIFLIVDHLKIHHAERALVSIRDSAAAMEFARR
jgi:hypothetical protein